MNWPIACWRDACPKKVMRFKHSDFIERTKRSANAFKFGGRSLGLLQYPIKRALLQSRASGSSKRLLLRAFSVAVRLFLCCGGDLWPAQSLKLGVFDFRRRNDG